MEYNDFDINFGVKGKTAVVTGGGAGIGKAIVELLMKKGADVIIGDISESVYDIASELSSKYGKKCLGLIVDLSDEEQIENFANNAWNEFNGIDILVNNAGVVFLNDAEKLSHKEWQKTIDINLSAHFYVSQAFGKKNDRKWQWRKKL